LLIAKPIITFVSSVLENIYYKLYIISSRQNTDVLSLLNSPTNKVLTEGLSNSKAILIRNSNNYRNLNLKEYLVTINRYYILDLKV